MFYSNAPDCQVLFFPFISETSELGPAKGDYMKTSTIVAGQDIISCQTSKAKRSQGSFVIQLSPSRNWLKLLHPGCWCMIYMSNEEIDKMDGKLKASEDQGFKMLGIVKSIRKKETINPETGTFTVRYLVAGEDFHSIFNVPIYINSNLSAFGQGQNATLSNSILLMEKDFRVVQPPHRMAHALINSLMGSPVYLAKSDGKMDKNPQVGRSGEPFKIPAETSKRMLGFSAPNNLFTGVLTMMLQNNLLGETLLNSSLSEKITVWSMLESYCHLLLNEIYTELLPVNISGETRLLPTLVLRAIPFSSSNFSGDGSVIKFKDAFGGGTRPIVVRSKEGRATTNKSLEGKQVKKIKGQMVDVNKMAHYYVSKEIYDSEMVALDVGKSDRERFNFFFVKQLIPGLDQTTEVTLLTDLMQGKISNIMDSKSIGQYGLRPLIAESNYYIKNNGKIIKTINKIVADIWHNAYLYENGTTTIIGQKIHIPVGTNIKFVDRDWVAHVEGVSHQFNVSPDGIKTYRTSIAFTRLQTSNFTPVNSVNYSSMLNFDTPNYHPGITHKYEGEK